MNNEKVTSKFTSCGNKGFSLGFENGLVISVQWGSMNYCERKSLNADYNAEMRQNIVQSTTAEIAIWDTNSVEQPDGTYVVNHEFNFGYDCVKGWCTANEVANWIQITAEAESIHDLYNLAEERGYIENPINLK